MVGEMIQRNLKDRVTTGKDFVNREINIVKGAVKDVGLVAKGEQAQLPRKANFPGRKGSLGETIPAAFLLSYDNLSTLIQDNIKIIRRIA